MNDFDHHDALKKTNDLRQNLPYTKSFFLKIDGTSMGPFSRMEVVDKLNSGDILPEDSCCPAGSNQWVRVANHVQTPKTQKIDRRIYMRETMRLKIPPLSKR
ncbi:MAG: hypothetical protein AAF984_10195 [Verrucomicrobiota bacterium]